MRSKHAGAASNGEAQVRPANSGTIRASPMTAPTEHQLLASKSNYEILTSGETSASTYSLASSLQASIGKKRAQHQQEEKVRRDRMKRALDLLADVLPPNMPRSPTTAKGKSKTSNRAETVEQAVEYINLLHAKLNNDININFRY